MIMRQNTPLTVLYVEDDPAHAEIALRNLKKNKIDNSIVHVGDGQQAMDYLLHQGRFALPESSPRPHLILLDLRLPKVDGLEVLQMIKREQELQSIPIVILTTSGNDADIAKAYQLGANSYLVKPIDFDKFTTLLETFGYYWMMWNKYPDTVC